MTHRPTHVAAATLALTLALAGCSSVENVLSGDRIDYKSQASRSSPLEVPPDLTQLQRDGRYTPQGGVVTASALQQQPGAAAATAAVPVAATAVGEMRIERQGNARWLVTGLSAEQVWPLVKAFWTERGFVLVMENPEAGVMETDWAENRGKIPMDFLRRNLSFILEPLFATGERDKFRTRIERVGNGTEIYISHRGVEEVLQGLQREAVNWRNRPADPQLEAEMLTRLMVRLGAKEEAARPLVANAPQTPARARLLAGQTGAMEIDEAFDRAWRRVGLALDRSGFTVEDRDRSGGLYYVRYADPKLAGQEEPGFFAKLFGGADKNAAMLQRFRVAVKASGDKTTVTVQNAQGAAGNTDIAQRIAGLLVDELK